MKSKRTAGTLSIGLTLCLIGLITAACASPTVVPAAGPTQAAQPEALITSTALISPLSTSTAGAEIVATATPAKRAIPAGLVRQAVVAGTWYPDDADELTSWVDRMLDQVDQLDGTPLGLLVPHAGYTFSGPVAAAGFKQLMNRDVDVAVIIASDHQAPISSPISVWAEGGFETPLGVVPVDVELANALIAADERISFDPEAHADEHVIELQLPFLQRVCPECSLVPILMGSDDEATIKALTEALLQALPGHKAVVIASSDLSHYPNQEDALKTDGVTLGAIESGDPARVRETIDSLMEMGIPNLVTCACGEAPILVTMQVATGLGADTFTVLSYANSADSIAGDPERVVGYGAVMMWRYDPPQLNALQQAELLHIARQAIAGNLEDEEIPDYQPGDVTLARPSGVFVTLKRILPPGESGDDLRGCIGHMRADIPLYRIVQEMAVSAATADTRFLPMTPEELDQVRIEISVLSPMRRVTNVEDIQVGTHGLMIYKDGRQGVLLPQVPVEQDWDREEFLDNLCLKAGLPAGCWLDGAVLYSFTAQVFSEELPGDE